MEEKFSLRRRFHEQKVLLWILFAVFPPELAEVFSDLGCSLLGVWLLLPIDTFRSAPGFRPFLDSGVPEPVYGLVFLAYGLVGWVGLMFDFRRVRAVKAFMGMVFWMALCIVFTVGNWRGPSFVFLMPFYTSNLLAFLKARPVKRNRG